MPFLLLHRKPRFFVIGLFLFASISAFGAISGSPAIESIRLALEPRPESMAGLGVDTATGAQTLSRIVLPFTAGQPFALALRYDSTFGGTTGVLGRGWRHDYQGRITGNPAERVTVSWGGHFQNTYRFVETVNGERRFVSDEPAARRDTLVLGTNNVYRLTRGDGTAFTFSAFDGELFEIYNKVGHRREIATAAAQGFRTVSVRALMTNSQINFAYDRDGQLDFVYDSQLSSGLSRYVDFSHDAQRRLTRISQPVEFAGSEFSWTPSQLTAPAGSATGVTADRAITRANPIGLVRISAGSISSGRSEDLVLRLTSPRGTTAILFDQVPDPTLTRNLAVLSTLSNAFEGEDPNGTWRLTVISRSTSALVRITGFGLRFSDPSNPTVFTYDTAHRMTSMTDPVGQIFAATYDAQGRIVTQDDGRTDNQLVRFSYNELPDDTLVTSITDRSGTSSTMLHDRRYRLLRWTDGFGQSITYTYDASGNRTTRTSPLGHQSRFAYDARYNLVSATDPAGKTTLFQYDANRNLLSVLDSRGTESRFGYDVRNNLISIIDSLGRTTTRGFNTNSQLTFVTMPDGARINLQYDGNNTINFVSHPANSSRGTGVSFDGQGRVRSRLDSDGGTTLYNYTITGQMLTEQIPDGRIRSYTYDARDRLLSETDLLGRTTRYVYDGNDNVALVTNALSESTRSTYDGEDRPLQTVDALNQTRSLAYDAVGQLIALTDGLGRTTKFRYDADGNPLSAENPAGVTTERLRYTSRGELESEAGAYDHATAFTYDDMGNLSAATDPAGRRTSYTYDTLNRHVALTDPASRISRQTFDVDGQVDSITGPGGQRTVFTYDSANRLAQVAYGPRTIAFTYNERDLTTEVNDSARRYRHEYDTVGRRIRTQILSPSSPTPERTLTYSYDANSNHLGTADSLEGRSVRRTVDALQRVASYTDAAGREVRYNYDATGRLSRLTYPGGRVVTYAYDAADQLSMVTDWADRRTQFAYDENGRISRIDFPNGTYRLMTYDRESRPLTRTDYDRNGAIICGYQYEFALDGRLEAVSRSDTVLRYVPSVATLTFDANNRATAFNGGALTSEFGGSLSRIPVASGFANVGYDSRQRVAVIGATSFFYDPEDRLTGWRLAGGDTTMTVDPHGGLSRVLELTPPAGAATRYVHGIGLLYEETGSSIRVYHYDDRGSTVALSDNAGLVIQRFAYGPYGEEFGTVAGGSTPFRFLGLFGVITEPNGTCSMRLRFYSPMLRRFISEDFYPGEIAAPASLNRFAYANGNPIAFQDPDGEFINVLIGALSGAIGGAVVQGVSDLYQGKKANWRDYVSAAAGGAVTGGLIGSGVGVAFAGGAGGLTQNFLEQSLNGALAGERDFNVVEFGVAGAIGAAAGAIGGRVLGTHSRGVNGAVSGAFRKQVIRNGVLYSSKRAALHSPLTDIVKRAAGATLYAASSGLIIGAAKGIGGISARRNVEDESPLHLVRLIAGYGESVGSASPGIAPSIASRLRYDQISSFMAAGQRSQQGAYLHFSLYQTWLSAALVPLPGSPNSHPSSF